MRSVSLVVSALLVSLAAADQPSAGDVRGKLLELEKQLNEAHLHGDVDRLKELSADELVVTVQEMPVMDKSMSVRIVQSGRVKFKRYETSEVKVNVFGDAAVVTGRLMRVRERQGKDIEDNWRFTKVYLHRDGKWQVVAWHGSQAAK